MENDLGISCFIVILECLYLLVSTYPLEHIRGIACVSGVMMIFALWACVYARELPSFMTKIESIMYHKVYLEFICQA